MGNAFKGEVTFEVTGKKYTLVYSNNAFCELENHLNRGILDIYAEIGSWSPPTDAKGKPLPETNEQKAARMRCIRLDFCRSLFWAGLIDHHPDLTVLDAGKLMEQVGGLMGAMNLISQGVVTAQPTEKERGPSRPPKGAARRGTGRAS